MKVDELRTIFEQHTSYWDSQREELKRLKALYMTEFWNRRSHGGVLADQLRVELPKGYKVVESYLGSLYARNPSVTVEPDIRGRGNPDVAEATANRHLLTVRDVLEDATRLALIFPCAFLKMAPVESPDPLKRVVDAALPPWEVIVDPTSPTWQGQRYIGHTYMMTLEEARTRYGSKQRLSAQAFTAQEYMSWLDQQSDRQSPTSRSADALQEGVTDSGKWVRIVEMYDLLDDAMQVWSPDYKNGERFLFEGVKVQVGALDPAADAETDNDALEKETEHVTSGIPYKTASGRPVVPIIPLYFSRDPEIPLRGYSLLRRIQDQLREANLLRTYQARGVRRMARQWGVRAGFLGDTEQAKIAMGQDGEFIEMDVPPGQSLEGNIIPIPNAPIPADIGIYAQTVMNDIDEASVLAPFTRGEATNTTATEQRLLTSYTSSEIGRMARIRDAVITQVAQTYNVMLSVMLGNEGEPLTLPVVGVEMLSADDLTGDFSYWATEGGSTPLSDMAKQEALVVNAPLLMQLGVPPDVLRAEIVRAFNFPESFNTASPPPPPGVATGLAPEPGPAGAEAPLLPEQGTPPEGMM